MSASVKLTAEEFSYLLRRDVDQFYRLFKKQCSCDPGDLRRESDGTIECGQCGRKIVLK